MGTDYIKCVFPGTAREYTYHRNGHDVKVGDMVNVKVGKSGELKTIKVTKVNISNDLPASIPINKILGVSPV